MDKVLTVNKIMEKLKPEIAIIAAISTNRVIGRDNQIPWHLSEDLKRFRRLTTGHPIIMGRKTFESIGKPLPKRSNIIVTRDPKYSAEGAAIAHSVPEAIEIACDVEGGEKIFIIGGGQIYAQSMNLADKLYLTVVEKQVEGDVFFPDYSDFKKVTFEQAGQNEELRYTFLDLTR